MIGALAPTARHVLPIFLADLTDIFSGVVVTLGGRFFIFTAGHCLDDQPGAAWHIGRPVDGSDAYTTLALRPRGVGFLRAEGVDAGVFEVEAVDGDARASLAHAALAPDQLAIVAGNAPSLRRGALGLGGYPHLVTGFARPGLPAVRPLSVTGFLADGVADVLTLEGTTANQIAISIPVDRMRNDRGPTNWLPLLAGMSGGACWHLEEGGAFKLVGTHTLSTDEEMLADGEHFRIAIATTLHAHLWLLLTSNVADVIKDRWPHVVDWEPPPLEQE